MIAASFYDGLFRKDMVMRDLSLLAKKYNRNLNGHPTDKPQLRRLSSIASVSSQADLLSYDRFTTVDPPKCPLGEKTTYSTYILRSLFQVGSRDWKLFLFPSRCTTI
jgi:hypothetical protein